MVKVRRDLTGETFGRLTVIEQVEDYIDSKGKHRSMWLCKCSCGNEIKTTGKNLKDKKVTSCGCYKRELAAERCKIKKKKFNTFSEKLTDEYGEYYIGYTNNTGDKFYVDADDFEKIKDYCWSYSIHHNGHRLTTRIEDKCIEMHRFLGFKYHDHKDRNRLNNRKYNLRPCTIKENSRNRSLQSNNTSGITGVRWLNDIKKWKAYIKVDGEPIYLGCYANKDDAIRERLKAEAKYFKEFAPQTHLFAEYNVKNNFMNN